MPGIFSQYDAQDLNRLAAKGILEKLRNIRQRINVDFTARRLLWELIQNAKDNAATCNINGNPKVTINIEIEPTKLSFSHNNGFFTNENIRGLVRRYSSSEKDREIEITSPPPSTTGRFGTGFMTTHLLSEKVLVNGFFQESELTFRKFELPLDRTGQTEKEIILSIEQAFNVIEESINKSEKFSISNSSDFKTLFQYSLDNEGLKLAETSVYEFDDCIPYTLINIPSIERVSVKQNGEIRFYEINKINEFQVENVVIEIIEVKTNNHNATQKHFATIIDDNTRIIIPIKRAEKFEIQKLNKHIPRLFLDFPMIGTEDLNVPFIINNPLFEPTEHRDGVSLTGGDDKDTQINSNILIKAFNLYKDFIDFVSCQDDWENLFNLARIKKPKEKVWINSEWIKTTIIEPMQSKLLITPLVTSNSGQRISIHDSEGKNQIYFPSSPKEDVRDKIWGLSNDLFPENLPLQLHIHEWHEIIWNECYEQTLESLTEDIQKENDIQTLSIKINKDEEKTIDWLNEFYDLVNFEAKFIDEIIKDKFSVIPNQNGVFKKRSELYIDQDIDEELKNVFLLLNIDLRDKLRHKLVKTASNYKKENDGQILYTVKNQETVIDEINKIISEGKNENISKACDYLTSCFSNVNEFPKEQELIYNFCNALWEMPEKKKLKNWSKSIWIEVNKLQIKWIIQTIADDKNIAKLSETLKTVESDTLKWLNSLVAFLSENNYDSQLNLKTSPILPNQVGTFCIKDNLFLDIGRIDENLKDIAHELGFEVREELLDINIFLELPENRIRTQEQLAEEISKLIKPILRDLADREEYKDVIRKLYLWMNKHRDVAENIFGEIYEKRFLLISDDEIAANIEKAEILDEIIGETGLSLKAIKAKLIELLTNPNLSKILEAANQSGSSVNMGLYPLGSEEDIQLSPSLMDVSSEKSRISVSEEARENILQTLKSKGFNVPSNLNINYTIVDGIISPIGKPIKIVVKSGKAGKIYFNPSEWLALTEEDSQLFVVTRGNVVRNITLSDIESINEIFHMRFNTNSFAMTNLKAFANFFRYLPYTHFIFETPESTTDYLQQFGLSERNPSSKELSSDDKNLLH
ncbi:MAG: hypothetical protein Q7U47_04690 [Paludibacter sp.]|nr:hypothetical protein [Paludibacter sp.]